METVIYGGSFDPPTKAHQAVIRHCLDRSVTGEVWVMPSGSRVDKQSSLKDTDRSWMLKLVHEEVFSKDPRLFVSSFELDYLPRPTQTYRTVSALKAHFPKHTFRFVFGADSYLDMPNWENGVELQQTLNILVVPRSGLEIAISNNVELINVDAGDISSTEVRNRVRDNLGIDGLVCAGVRRYIEENRLYVK